ncbi:hypothetical protein SAMN04488007_3702 [Maribacter aquivivus]|uniref:Uncharacterized protein n=1 Tax=Maribacter aquivivus TaxID=228958 RepID=A0A1M6UV94_9FLAO|nr:hypothetical protein [Maribacter aquivivus]SHK73152.1 hypothetical protein SAMN04488007_3702 [Maribacter aquivivus]
MKIGNWKKNGFEFLSIFIAVISAFALNNWNDNRRDSTSEQKILREIANGLVKDLEDVRGNEGGHKLGISASQYFKNILTDKPVDLDSLGIYYFIVTRDFVSIQNVAGYETLKSQGLELIKNDSLRLDIISLYEYDYQTLRKLEEEYSEIQFNENYFKEINQSLAPNFQFNADQNIVGIDLPINITTEKKKIILTYLWKIEKNRKFILQSYAQVETNINKVLEKINTELSE